MGILQNARREMIGPFKLYGLTALNSSYPAYGVANMHLTGPTRNINAGVAMDNELVSLPSGNRHPNVWMMPQKPGALAARGTVEGVGTLSGTALAVKLAVAALTGAGGITDAEASRIIQLLADLVGSGSITDADLKAFLQILADLTGTGGVSSATLQGFGAMLSALTGSGTAAGSILTGIGELDADIVVTGTGLTTANVGPAVWGTLIEGGFSAEQLLKLIAAAAAGKLEGAPGGPIEITGVDGSTIRITAEVDGNGNRLTVTYDVS